MDIQPAVTRAQTKFLRAFAANPAGPPPDEWPSPVVLRRWLKKPGFCGAMNSILRAMRYQADFHLTAAAASGAHLLHGAVHGGDPLETRRTIESLIHLLRMNHIRQRFAEPLPQAQPSQHDLIRILRESHPAITVEAALHCFDGLTEDDRAPGAEGYGHSVWRRTGHPETREWGYDPAEKEEDEQDEEEE